MPNRPLDLPDYDRPPVNEVVLGVQFGSLAALKTPHIGFLWKRWRDRYPVVSEQPPLEPAFETFPSVVGEPGILFESLIGVPFPRVWFESEDGSDLCQIQKDRLIHNWRKRENAYPHYEYVRGLLVDDLRNFGEFAQEEGLGELVFNQAEVSYINTIDLPDGRSPHAALDEVLSTWRQFSLEGEIEDTTFRARYRFKRDEVPYARLHVAVTPAVRRADGKHIIKLEMTFRGKPENDSQDAALALLDVGRGVIVRSFDKMTSPEMHQVWGRKQ